MSFSLVSNGTGQATATFSADFTFTQGPGDRWVHALIDNRFDVGDRFNPLVGTQSYSVNIGCLGAGTYPVRVRAYKCPNEWPGDPGMVEEWNTTFTTPVAQGSVSVQYDTDPLDGSIRIYGSYSMPPGAGSATLKIEELASFDEGGNFIPTRTLREQGVSGPGGQFEIKPFAPATGALQVKIKATLWACSWQAEATTAPPCGGCPYPPNGTGDPVSFADGNMRYIDSDPLPRQLDALDLTRTYDTRHRFRSFFGRGWWTFFDARLVVHGAPSGDTIAITTETNESAMFLRRGGIYSQLWPMGQSVPDTLTFESTAGLYVLRRAGSGVASLYRVSDGRFAGMRQLGTGREMRVEWSAQGLPLSVTDSWSALTWSITTDAAKRRVTQIAITDLAWRYEYDANDNLARVLAPQNATWRTYAYVNNQMTEMREAAGRLIESHAYNSAGSAIDSTGPTDEIQSIEYVAGSAPNERTARVTMKTGAVADYVLQSVAGAYRTVRIRGGCASCGARDASYVYDAQGHLVREQEASGYINVHTYTNGRRTAIEDHLRPQSCDPATDPNRCRLEPAALASAALQSTAATLRTEYAYTDPNWPDRATSVTMASVFQPGRSRVVSTTYHALSGEVIRSTVSGWTSGEPSQSGELGSQSAERGSATSFYGETPPSAGDTDAPSSNTAAFDPGGTFQSAWLVLTQPSMLKRSIDGPRSDVADVTQFVYYPVSPSVPAELRGRLAAVKNAAGHVTRYESYDVFGNPKRIVDPNGVATEMEYDILGRLKSSTTKGIAGCSTNVDLLCATDLVSSRTYAPLAGPLESETAPGGGVTKYVYDERDRVKTISRGPSMTDQREKIEYTYDTATANRSLETISAFENGTWVEKTRQSFTYDTLGQLKDVVHAAVNNQTASMSYEYDAEGQVSKIRDENHSTPNTRYEYDPAGRVAKVTKTLASAAGGEITTRYAYDTLGNLTSVTDPNGNITSYIYDDFGQIVSERSPATGTTNYQHDEGGNLTQTTDARGARTTRSYDPLGRVSAASSTHNGITETVTWTYDDPTAGRFGIGRLVRMIDPVGYTDYSYERRGLLIKEHRAFNKQPSATPPVGDGRGGPPQPPPPPSPPGGDGRLTPLSDGGPRVPAPSPGSVYQAITKFAYDRDGNRSSITYPSTMLTVNYTYDFAGRPITASNVITSAKYLPFGPLTELKFANNTTQKMDYDARYRMISNELIKGGNASVAFYGMKYDAAGNIVSIGQGKNNAVTDYDRTFQYDDLHRLTKADTGSALWVSGTYEWDAMGNIKRTQITEVIPGDDTEALSVTNPKKFKPNNKRKSKKDAQRLGIQPLGREMTFAYKVAAGAETSVLGSVALNGLSRTVGHDDAGNEKSYAVERSYSPRNLLASVADSLNSEEPGPPHSLAYEYDGRGVRVKRTESPSNGPNTLARRYYTYLPELRLLSASRDDAFNVWEPEAEPRISYANNTHYEIIWFGDRPVAQFNPGYFTRYTFTDHLGTPIIQTDTSASVVWRVEYEPFGSVFEVREGSRTEQPLRLPGQEVAMTWEGPEESFNVHRWYKTGWGRYSSADPIGVLRPADLENLYAYAESDPIGVLDPTGLDAITNDPKIQKCAYCIFTQAGSGFYNSEESLFIICDPNGGYDCAIWPSTFNQGTSQKSSTTFKGVVPANTCGIMHTHPKKKPGKPSDGDIALATQFKLPLYTLHPTGLWKYDPQTKKTTEEADYQWIEAAEKVCGKGNPCKGLTKAK